jgi:hypothetical protein
MHRGTNTQCFSHRDAVKCIKAIAERYCCPVPRGMIVASVSGARIKVAFSLTKHWRRKAID